MSLVGKKLLPDSCGLIDEEKIGKFFSAERFNLFCDLLFFLLI